MRITQGTFSFLPDLTDAQIAAQIEYALQTRAGPSPSNTPTTRIRATPTGRCTGMPMFDLKDAAGVLMEINACRKAFPNHYIQVNAFDSTRGMGVAAPVVHRQPAAGRARLRARRGRKSRPRHPLHHRRLRDRAARGERYDVTSSAGHATHRHGERRRRRATERRPARAAAPTPDVVERARRARPRADRPRAGQDADPRDRRAAAGRARARALGLDARAAVAAHVLHRQPGHRQDDRRAADGGRSCTGWATSAKATSSPSRATTWSASTSATPRRRRKEVLKRAMGGVLFIDEAYYLYRPGERARLRPGGDRDPAAGDGEPARRPGRDPRRLQGPDGHVLPQQSRHVRRASPTTSTSPTTRADELLAIARADARTACTTASAPRREAALRDYIALRRRRSRISPTRARSATRSTARGCARRTACSPAPATVTRDALQTIAAADIRASRVFTEARRRPADAGSTALTAPPGARHAYGRTTFSKFIIEEQRRMAEPDPQLTALSERHPDRVQVHRDRRSPAARCRRHASAAARPTSRAKQQKPLDVIANDIMLRSCEWGGQLCGMVVRGDGGAVPDSGAVSARALPAACSIRSTARRTSTST